MTTLAVTRGRRELDVDVDVDGRGLGEAGEG